MKKIIIPVILIMAIFTCSLFFGDVHAVTTDGYCGQNVTWSFDDDTRVLTISGTGNMDDYDVYADKPVWAPWCNSDEVECERIDTIVIESGVTSIGDCSFYGLPNVTKVVIGDTVSEIGTYSFMELDYLTSVGLPDSVKTIGKGAFQQCDNLKSVNLNEGLLSIKDHAFYISKLKNISLPSSLKEIGSSAFSMTDITSITIPTGVKKINRLTFNCCDKLTKVTIPESVTEIGQQAFGNCKKLKNVDLPSNIKKIGRWAFDDDNVAHIKTKTSMKSLKKSKKAFTVVWAKKSNITGYQIRYSTKSNMSGAKKATVNKAGTTKSTIKKLKSKKKYYVQVRTYKIFSGSKYYSLWSAKKSVVTK